MADVPVVDEKEPLVLKDIAVSASVTEPSLAAIVGVTSHVLAAVFQSEGKPEKMNHEYQILVW